MDQNMMMYFLHRFQEARPKASIQIQGKIQGHGMWFVSNDKGLTTLVSKGFYMQNIDNIIQLWFYDIPVEMVVSYPSV